MILQKVHWKLTLLCTGITAFIMLVMSLIYLHLSETQLFQNELYSFAVSYTHLTLPTNSRV